jgi:futalosine hydrolase
MIKVKPRQTFQNLSKEKQERITRIAVEEFSNKGFEGASINAMVGRLKIAKGSIFQYFGDKKGLFLFVFKRSVEMVKEHLRTVRDQSIEEDLPTRLSKTLSAGIQFTKKHPLLYRLYIKMLFESKALFRDEMLLSLRQNSIEYLQSLLDNAYTKGEIKKNIDINKAAFVLDAVMDRFLQAHTIKHLDADLGIYGSNSGNTDLWIHEIVAMICQGVGKTREFETTIRSVSPLSAERPYILIIASVDGELVGLAKKLKNPTQSCIGGRTCMSGSMNSTNVKLLTTGPGIVNASQALTACIESEPPAMIIQTGCAGTFRQSGLRVGDIGVASEEIDIHSGLEPPSGAQFPDDLPFALIEKKSAAYKGHYPINANLINTTGHILKSAFAGSSFQVKKGPFITVSTITTTDNRANALFNEFQPCMEQMEGAGAAHIALYYEIPFLEIRSAGNMVGKRDIKSWNLPLAFKNACKAVYFFIQSFDTRML